MVKWLKNEFWNGYTTFEKIFFASLIPMAESGTIKYITT